MAQQSHLRNLESTRGSHPLDRSSPACDALSDCRRIPHSRYASHAELVLTTGVGPACNHLAMEIARLEDQNDYLERLVKTAWHGLEELVWNAIDADTTNITCRLERTVANSIDALVIEDNGTGFNRERAELSFGKLGGSWKAQATATEAGRAIHGRAGQGRFAAFGIGDAG